MRRDIHGHLHRALQVQAQNILRVHILQQQFHARRTHTLNPRHAFADAFDLVLDNVTHALKNTCRRTASIRRTYGIISAWLYSMRWIIDAYSA